MAIICEKDLTLHIGSPPLAYYKLDDLGPGIISGQAVVAGESILTDSIAGLNMVNASAGNPTTTIGKIGNAIRHKINYQKFDPAFAFAFSGTQQFTIRIWLRVTASTTHNGFFTSNSSGSGSSFWQFNHNAVAAEDVRFRVGSETFTIYAVTSDPFLINDWQHVVAYCNPGTEIGLIVNDGTPKTTAMPENLDSNIDGIDTTLDGVDSEDVDEICIWNRLLTASEITADYNAGVGRTWPF